LLIFLFYLFICLSRAQARLLRGFVPQLSETLARGAPGSHRPAVALSPLQLALGALQPPAADEADDSDEHSARNGHL
jgi:hypothetical protein